MHQKKLNEFSTTTKKKSLFRLPEWAKKIMIPGGKFEYLANYWIKSISGTTEMKKLKSGFILKDIFDRFKNKTLAKLPGQLMHIYSGHDITIASVLNGLGLLEVFTHIFLIKNLS